MADVFFSYKREDRARVERIVRLLESEGLTVWWDPSLVAGERFEWVISREINQARCVLVAWSASSVGAMWVRDEAAIGHERGILVPLSLDGARPPLGFGGYQTPDLSDWAGEADDRRIQQLIAGVRRAVSSVPGGQDGAHVAPREAAFHAPTSRVPTGERVRSTHLSRRRLLRIGLAAGTVGAVSAAGLWYSAATWSRASIPSRRTEEFDLITVGARGEAMPPQRASVEVFEVPIGGTTMEFSVIPGGGFLIGSPSSESQRQPNEGPQEQITVRSFALGRTAVTQAQWANLVAGEPEAITHELARQPSTFRSDSLPVETVSWNHATEFCGRLSRATGLTIRLPSEAEWEYACRAFTTSAFHFGPTVTSEQANYCGTGGAVCGMDQGEDISSPVYGGVVYPSGSYADGPAGPFNGKTQEVRTYPPNRFGLYEMHGNVWEHCLDDAGPVEYSQLPADGTPFPGSGNNHVLRGGSWSHNPSICRSAYRDAMASDYAGWEGRVGLRVACELGEEVSPQN